MRKPLFTLLLFAFILSFFTAFSPSALAAEEGATDYRIVISDKAGLLEEDEIEALKADMEPVLQYSNAGFFTVPEDGNAYGSAEALIKRLSWDTFGRTGQTQEDAVCFLIDMDTREIYLYSNGSARSLITVSDAVSITDNTYRYASFGDFYSCASATFRQVTRKLQSGVVFRPMMIITTVLLSLLISAFIMYLVVRATMKMRGASSADLQKAAVASVQTGTIEVIDKGSTRVYSPIRSSGGGGGGGGHSGGGGGGRFGGGGHGGGHGF